MFKHLLVFFASLFVFSSMAMAQTNIAGHQALTAANTFSTWADEMVQTVSDGIQSDDMAAFCAEARAMGKTTAMLFYQINVALHWEHTQTLYPPNEIEIWFYVQAIQIIQHAMSLIEEYLPEECR